MNIEQEIAEIKKRNQRVEADKRWETGWLRRISVCVLTFVVVLIYNIMIENSHNVWLNSAVPVIAFFLSTLSLDLIRKIWEKRR